MNHIRNAFVEWSCHLVLLGCSCQALSQTRSQAPEYAKMPKNGLFCSDYAPITFSALEALLIAQILPA